MEEQTDKGRAIRKYEFFTKKAELLITVISFVLFFISLTKSIFSVSSIAFFAFIIIVFIYYFVWYRKKPAYITVGEASILVSRGFFFKIEEIKNDDIKGVSVTDSRLEIRYLKRGTQTSVSIFDFLLEKKDKDELIKYLKGLVRDI